MDTSYAWHPGSHGLGAAWLRPVALQPDELFSTWLARAALAQGCDPLTLTGSLWPDWRAWTVDLDRCVSKERLASVADAAGLSAGALAAATVRSYALSVAGSHSQSSPICPWILATGARNRLRRGGLMYCPSCLATDRAPYFRMHWRFAWQTVCQAHAIMLHDRCMHCGASPVPHQALAQGALLTCCGRCGFDLTTAPKQHASPQALGRQLATDRVARGESGGYGGLPMDTRTWFALLKSFIAVLRTAALGQSGRAAALVQALGVDLTQLTSPETGLPFELIPVHERAMLLGAAHRLIACDPGVLGQTAERVCATAAIGGIARFLPSGATNSDISRKRYGPRSSSASSGTEPRSETSVKRSWARFKRKHDLQ